MTKSRFSNLLQPKKAKATKSARSRKKLAPPEIPSDQAETQEITVRRAVGKRSKADYTQVSAYVPKQTHKDIRTALIEDGRDFSELVTDLLAEWLRSR